MTSIIYEYMINFKMFTFSGHDVIKPLRLSPLVCYYSIRIISTIKNIPLKYDFSNCVTFKVTVVPNAPVIYVKINP